MTFVEESAGLLSIQLFDQAECRSLVSQAIEADGWYDASIRIKADSGANRDVLVPDARIASVLPLVTVPGLAKRFDAQVDALIKPLIACYWDIDLHDHDGSQVVRYQVGGHYETHDDAGDACGERQFSIVCYLNDGFTGGGTHFPDLEHTVVPKCGKAIVFPARYLHRAERVTAGEKIVVVSWVVTPASS